MVGKLLILSLELNKLHNYLFNYCKDFFEVINIYIVFE